VVFAIALQYLPLDPAAADTADRVGLTLMRMQSQYIVGVNDLMGNSAEIYRQALALDTGSLGQRQRFVILAAEIVGPAEAGQRLVDLDGEIRRELERQGSEFRPAESQMAVQSTLRRLYLAADGTPVSDDRDEHAARIAALPQERWRELIAELGWFGELALTPDGTDVDESRSRLMRAPHRVMLGLALGLGVLATAGLAGLVAWVLLLIRAVRGEVRLAFRPGRGPHGVYAETFALWIAGFFVLQLLAGLAARVLPGNDLTWAMLAFLASLVALCWPMLRGVTWAQVRNDIGLIPGAEPRMEPLFGVGGYLMAIPLLAVGVVGTLVLLALQGLFTPPLEPFAPAGGPAHPVVLEIAAPGWWVKLQVLLLASVIAPFVEETMFRGVLYRHLRGATSGMGRAASVLAAGGLSSLVFAAIHPQGWVAIPALMSLALAFVWLREWRGTLLPAMLAHGISNGVVMLVLILLLRA
jgi:membrane protease YdiL (CAAX protease family)